MRFFYGFLLIAVFTISGPAHAKSWADWIFTPPWPDFERPYLEDGKTPQDVQWDNDPWKPEDWIIARGDLKAVLSGLHDAGIVVDDDISPEDEQPVLGVGYNFMRLSGQDKVRVVKFVDFVYGATKSKSGALIIKRSSNNWLSASMPIGVYTKQYGLQLH